MVQEIELKELFIHPKNVRKHYDGIEELAESIKEKGILQNLTVIPGHYVTDEEWKELADEYAVNPTEEIRNRMNAKAGGGGRNGWSDYGYTVVIGNRRLTAARAAGIKTAPCMVSEMSEKEQVATMLLENMQRKDLTPYEESGGFQMCLDLGLTEDELAKKTGLSKKTIKHRTKIQLLDQEKVEEACENGATIFDFIKLEQIKDVAKRNEVLQDIGTPNFNYRVECTIREEKKAEAIEKVVELYKTFATERPAEDPEGMRFITAGTWYNDPSRMPEKPEDAGETKYWYSVASYGVTLWKEWTAPKEPDVPAQAAIERAERDKRNAAFAELGEMFYQVRRKHLESRSRQVISPEKIYRYMTTLLLLGSSVEWKDENANGYYNGGLDPELYAEIAKTDRETMTVEGILERIEKAPLKEMERIIYSSFECGRKIPCKTWDGYYEPDADFENLYLFLQDTGYSLSDEEMQIIGGTHPLYKKKEEAEA